MAEEVTVQNQDDKSMAQKVVEGFGLDYPDDAEKLVKVLEENSGEGGTLGGIFQALIEAFPEKKDQILGIPMFTEIDGEVYRVTMPREDYDQVG